MPLGSDSELGRSEIGWGLHVGVGRYSLLNLWGAEQVTAVLSLLLPTFAASNPNERTPTAQSRNTRHQPHAHPTPNTNTKPQYLPRTNTS